MENNSVRQNYDEFLVIISNQRCHGLLFEDLVHGWFSDVSMLITPSSWDIKFFCFWLRRQALETIFFFKVCFIFFSLFIPVIQREILHILMRFRKGWKIKVFGRLWQDNFMDSNSLRALPVAVTSSWLAAKRANPSINLAHNFNPSSRGFFFCLHIFPSSNS